MLRTVAISSAIVILCALRSPPPSITLEFVTRQRTSMCKHEPTNYSSRSSEQMLISEFPNEEWLIPSSLMLHSDRLKSNRIHSPTLLGGVGHADLFDEGRSLSRCNRIALVFECQAIQPKDDDLCFHIRD